MGNRRTVKIELKRRKPSFISNVVRLLLGDVIATGIPSGIGRMKPSDVVEVKIENIGTLRNYVVAWR